MPGIENWWLMRRIRVLEVITGLGAGGAERLLLDMMRHFNTDKFDVRVVSITGDLNGLKVFGQQDHKIEVFDLKTGSRVSSYMKMRAYVKNFAPDVIHAHMFHSLLVSLGMRKFLFKKPAICFTSHRSNYSIPRTFLVRLLRKLRDADVVFTEGQHPKQNCNRIEIIPNGVHVSAECPSRKMWNPAGRIRLLAVGRLIELKNPLGILQSMADINLPGLTIDFLGTGPLEIEARNYASQLGIADRAKFHGVRSDVGECMKRADVFVMQSRNEGMPMALLEAGAEAMPVVATPVGSIPSLLGEDRGWMAVPEAFAVTLRAVIENPTFALAAGRRLHAHVLNNNSISKTVLDHERLYSSLAAIIK